MAPAFDLNPGTQTWKGRTGRTYRARDATQPHKGSKATVRPVLAEGPPVGSSWVAPGTVLALKLPWKGNPDAPDAIDREATILTSLSGGGKAPPCPQLYDVLVEERHGPGRPRVMGMFMEWCPENMERWWLATWRQPEAFASLTGALAEVCERIQDYQALLAGHAPPGQGRPSARLKPRNVSLGSDNRWLLSDFEEVQVKSLYDEHLSLTQPLLGGENFLSPEVLFNASRQSAAAMDTWSVGCILYALLRVRPFLSAGAALPFDGTNSPHFRTHRMHLVTDLHTRKPTLLAGRDLDPSLFLYPDRLPDQDRRAVLQSLEGIFGARDESRETTLANEVVRVLDRALRVDPLQRYTDPAEMARDLRELGRLQYRLATRGESSDEMSDEATMLLPARPSSKPSGAPEASPPAPPVAGPALPSPISTPEPASFGKPPVVPARRSTPPAPPPPAPPPAQQTATTTLPATVEDEAIPSASLKTEQEVTARAERPAPPTPGPAAPPTPVRSAPPPAERPVSPGPELRALEARLRVLEASLGDGRPRAVPTWVPVVIGVLMLTQIGTLVALGILLLR